MECIDEQHASRVASEEEGVAVWTEADASPLTVCGLPVGPFSLQFREGPLVVGAQIVQPHNVVQQNCMSTITTTTSLRQQLNKQQQQMREASQAR